jgi:hypothetical protein
VFIMNIGADKRELRDAARPIVVAMLALLVCALAGSFLGTTEPSDPFLSGYAMLVSSASTKPGEAVH